MATISIFQFLTKHELREGSSKGLFQSLALKFKFTHLSNNVTQEPLILKASISVIKMLNQGTQTASIRKRCPENFEPI